MSGESIDQSDLGIEAETVSLDDFLTHYELEEKTREELEKTYEKFRDGFEYVFNAANPYNLDIQEVENLDEVLDALGDTSRIEGNPSLKKDYEAFLHNNAEIERLDNRIIELSELSEQEREALYNNEETSDIDKAIIAEIAGLEIKGKSEAFDVGSAGMLYHLPVTRANDKWLPLYGFAQVEARAYLNNSDSHFKILTKKEIEEVGSNSIEDIASAALESFIGTVGLNENNLLDTNELAAYDEYLYKVLLESTERRVQKGQIVNEVNEYEFRDRVTNSVYVGDWHSKTPEESDEVKQEKATNNEIRARSGLLYPMGSLRYRLNAEIQRAGDKSIAKRVRNNYEKIFKHSEKMAKAEVEPWVDKIDVDKLWELNDDDTLSYEEKVEKMARLIQSAFEIESFEGADDPPISINWFRYERDEEPYKKLHPSDDYENDEYLQLPIGNKRYGGWFTGSTQSVYLPKKWHGETKVGLWDLNKIAHELWHARQYQEVKKDGKGLSFSEDVRTHSLRINWKYYVEMLDDYKGYLAQQYEMEACAMGSALERRFYEKRCSKFGKIINRIYAAALGGPYYLHHYVDVNEIIKSP